MRLFKNIGWIAEIKEKITIKVLKLLEIIIFEISFNPKGKIKRKIGKSYLKFVSLKFLNEINEKYVMKINKIIFKFISNSFKLKVCFLLLKIIIKIMATTNIVAARQKFSKNKSISPKEKIKQVKFIRDLVNRVFLGRFIKKYTIENKHKIKIIVPSEVT